jgi:ribosomal protein RSM22 (predicted rRNA methylase)
MLLLDEFFMRLLAGSQISDHELSLILALELEPLCAHNQWGDHISEYQCIDTSQKMNEVASSLLRGKQDTEEEWDESPPHIRNVYFKQFMPMSDKVCYDVVVSAYTLEDIPTLKLRRDMIKAMWKKASTFLVIIESGTPAGFNNVLLSRETALGVKSRLINSTAYCI